MNRSYTFRPGILWIRLLGIHMASLTLELVFNRRVYLPVQKSDPAAAFGLPPKSAQWTRGQQPLSLETPSRGHAA